MKKNKFQHYNLILLILHIVYKEALIDTLSYDNERIFKTPFHLNYFKASVKEVKSLRNCVTIAILFALQLCAKFIPLPSPSLNEALGGGLPRKRITILSGVESAGKTGTLLEAIALQQKKDPNFFALWLESEDSLDPDFMDMLGVDQSRFTLVMHDKERGAEVVIDELLALAETGI